MTVPRNPDWAALDDAAKRHGPAFYIADVARFGATVTRLLDAFRHRYPSTSLAYSYKTNYLPAFIRRAHDLGAWSEVVSRFEYDYARGLGIEGERILFNGPIKSEEDIGLAFADGARVQADSLEEVARLVSTRGPSAPAAVGLRCNLGSNTPGSRFGIVLESADGRAAIRAIDGAPHLRLASLHAHHSADRSADILRERAERLIVLHRSVLGGRPLDFIDVGGGLASAMEPALAAQFAEPPPSHVEYADAIAGTFARAYATSGPGLMIEPGIGVLGDALQFVARVEGFKDLQGGRFAVLAGSVFNVKPLRHGINLPASVAARPGAGRRPGPHDLVGFTCMEKSVDLLHRDWPEPLAVGDYVVVRNVGAYTTVLNAPFIRGTPAVLALESGRPGRLLRRASTAADLLSSYEEP